MENDFDINDCWNKIGVWGRESPRCPELDRVVHCINCNVYADTGRRLLDRNTSAEYIAERTEEIAKETKKTQERNTSSVVVFRVGDEWLGLPTNLFQEVVEFRKVHSVPHRRGKILRGLVNIRGELQLCVSLGQLLGIQRGEVHGNNVVNGIYERMMLIAKGDARYVFPVGEVRGVLRYTHLELLNQPATAAHDEKNYLCGMLYWKEKGQERHIGCLDENLLFASLERGIA